MRVGGLHMFVIVRSILGALALAVAASGCAGGPPDPSVYCYHTLAQADCYGSPRRGQAYRLNGDFGPAPL